MPLSLAATLADGLGPDSRIRQRRAGLKVPTSIFMLAQAIDLLAAIRWMWTEDAKHGRNAPDSISAKLIEQQETTTGQFETPDQFEAWRAKLTGEGES